MNARSASVLLVEDEALIRLMLVDMLEEDLGHRVVAEAGSVLEGKSLAENTEFDLAILDINLCGRNVLPVAQAIEKRGVPFLFVSGYLQTDERGCISWLSSGGPATAAARSFGPL
jgi:DNA-binding response OmpR family regulator